MREMASRFHLWWMMWTTRSLRRYEIRKRVEKFQMYIVWHLPRWVVYWSIIRANSQTVKGDEYPLGVTTITLLSRLRSG